jgi:hypothetical protein
VLPLPGLPSGYTCIVWVPASSVYAFPSLPVTWSMPSVFSCLTWSGVCSCAPCCFLLGGVFCSGLGWRHSAWVFGHSLCSKPVLLGGFLSSLILLSVSLSCGTVFFGLFVLLMSLQHLVPVRVPSTGWSFAFTRSCCSCLQQRSWNRHPALLFSFLSIVSYLGNLPYSPAVSSVFFKRFFFLTYYVPVFLYTYALLLYILFSCIQISLTSGLYMYTCVLCYIGFSGCVWVTF